MTYYFSNRSLQRLSGCHHDLEKIMNTLIQEMDVTILCGYRNQVEQNKSYLHGKSKLKYPSSKHNKKPSLAVDVAPYPIDWNDIDRFKDMVKRIKRIAKNLGIEIRCGADFITFKDYPHIELVK